MAWSFLDQSNLILDELVAQDLYQNFGQAQVGTVSQSVGGSSTFSSTLSRKVLRNSLIASLNITAPVLGKSVSKGISGSESFSGILVKRVQADLEG